MGWHYYSYYTIFNILCYNENMDSQEIITLITDYFSQQADIDTVILFGSFAKNTFNEHSDIDLAIHSDKKLDYERLSSIQTELALLTHREIDLADLSKAEGLFLYQIMTTGIKIKLNKSVFVRYLVEALCFKEDFLPIIEYSRKEKIRRFVNG